VQLSFFIDKPAQAIASRRVADAGARFTGIS
jgi:hypothetical protein